MEKLNISQFEFLVPPIDYDDNNKKQHIPKRPNRRYTTNHNDNHKNGILKPTIKFEDIFSISHQFQI